MTTTPKMIEAACKKLIHNWDYVDNQDELRAKVYDAITDALVLVPGEPGGWIWEDEFTTDPATYERWVEAGREAQPFYFNSVASPAPLPVAVKEGQFLPTEDGEFNGNAWEGDLTAEEQSMVDAAWETHKAALPVARVINDNQPGNTAIVEVLSNPPTLVVGTELFTAPVIVSTVAVKIKPLEWVDKTIPLMQYHAECDDDGEWRYSVFGAKMTGPYTLKRYGVHCGEYPTIDEAKAAAQSDYESRIRSALSSPVGGTIECEGRDDPEERCHKHPSECTCWEVDNDHPMRNLAVSSPTPASDIAALREENERLREALKPFAKYAGDPSHIKQRAFLQLLICPVGDEHPDNHVPYFQAARAALAHAVAPQQEEAGE